MSASKSRRHDGNDFIIIIIITLFAREQYSKQVQMTVEMSRTIRRKDTHLQMPFNKHTETSTAS